MAGTILFFCITSTQSHPGALLKSSKPTAIDKSSIASRPGSQPILATGSYQLESKELLEQQKVGFWKPERVVITKTREYLVE